MNKIISKISLKNIAIILLIAIFFIADRYLKLQALGLPVDYSYKLLGDIFSFSFTPNYYMAFSLPLGGIILNSIIIAIILGLIYVIFYLILKKRGPKYLALLLTIILFGAISNILDRLVCGYVIDYFELRYFTVFNLADTGIFIGACYLIIKSLKKDNMKNNLVTAENLQFVLQTLTAATADTKSQARRVSPTKENAVELLLLHDLKDLIKPAKKEGTYNQDLLQSILIADYQQKMQSGKCSTYFNFRKVLENPEYLEHFRALVSEMPVSQSQLN